MEQVHDNHWVEIVDGETTKLQVPMACLRQKLGRVWSFCWADCYQFLTSGMIGAVHAGRKGTNRNFLKETMTAIKTLE